MCDQCIKGYTLTPNGRVCIKSSDAISNCRQLLDWYGKRCKVCDEGYYADDEDSCSELSSSVPSPWG